MIETNSRRFAELFCESAAKYISKITKVVTEVF